MAEGSWIVLSQSDIKTSSRQLSLLLFSSRPTDVYVTVFVSAQESPDVAWVNILDDNAMTTFAASLRPSEHILRQNGYVYRRLNCTIQKLIYTLSVAIEAAGA